jgi:hypothetical protein
MVHRRVALIHLPAFNFTKMMIISAGKTELKSFDRCVFESSAHSIALGL